MTNNLEQLSAAIIAGGKSKRFGFSKVNARFRDKRLLDYAVRLGAALSSELFIVSAPDVPISEPPATVIHDAVQGCGPIGGIYTALIHSESDFVAIVPCDMPLLAAEVYRLLHTHIDPERPVVATSEKGLEPMVSIWPKAVMPVIRRQIENQRFSLRYPLKQLNAISVYVPEAMPGYNPDWFGNINYQKDLERLNQLERAV